MGIYKNNILSELALETKERNELKKSEFGIPELRKYPLTDERHVSSAITYFNKCDPKYEEELARRIIRAIHKFEMNPEVSDANRLSKYYNTSTQKIKESVNSKLF